MPEKQNNPNHVTAKEGPLTIKGVEIGPFSPAEYTSIYQLSVSGPHGLRGQDGYSYDYLARDGGMGQDGERGASGHPGQPGTPGITAGNIQIELQIGEEAPTTRWGLPFDKSIRLKADATFPDGQQRPLNADLELPFNADIQLFAIGGNGGRGGDGGKGQRGGDGGRGRDANRHRRGGNGGNGGRGGSGGAAGRGGDAGHGGKIEIIVPGDEKHLIMLTENDVDGGFGGDGGIGGSGGSGGRGGSGGSGYSWREYAGKDSNGNAKYRFRSNPGGSSGRNGEPGLNGSHGVDGTDGKDGKLVLKPSFFKPSINAKTFERRYAIEVIDYELRDAYQDEIWEPGERIYLSRLTIRNSGGMPLPEKRHVYLLVRNNNRVISDSLALELPVGLQPNESHTFSEELSLVLRLQTANEITDQPFKEMARVDPGAIMGGVQKTFREASLVSELPIRFPVEISPISGHNSIAKGEATRISWTVTNVSSLDQGYISAFKRRLETLFLVENSSDPDALSWDHILLFDKFGRSIDLNEGFDQEIPFIAADDEHEGVKNHIEQIGFLGIHPDAKPMTIALSKADLKFALPDNPEATREIQYSPFQIRVAKKYQKTQGSDILLVINKDTHIRTVQDIVKYYEGLGSTVDIWDISHYGLLNLEHRQANGNTLMHDFEGKTILVINNGYKSNQLKEIHSHQLIDKRQFLRGANDYGITFYVVGKTQVDRETVQTRLNLPTMEAKSISYFDSRKKMRRAFRKRFSESIKEEEGVLTVPLGDIAEEVDNFSNRAYVWRAKGKVRFWNWYRFSQDRLKKKALSILKDLEQKYPREQFYAVYNWKGQPTKRFLGGLTGEIDWGTITIRQAPHRLHGGRMVSIQADEKSLLDGSFFRGPNTAYHLALGLTIWESREAFEKFLDQQPDLLTNVSSQNAFFQACMYHIAAEQANLRMHKWTRLSRKELEENLVFLKLITSFSLKFNSLDSPQARFFSRLFATTLALVQVQHYKLNWLFPRNRNLRLTRIVRRMIDEWIERNFDTSREVKRIDPRLWEKNDKDKAAFRAGVEKLQEKFADRIKEAHPKWKTRGDAFLDELLHGVEGSERQRNRIFEQQEFETLKISDEGRQVWLDWFEDSETEMIEDMTYHMKQVDLAGKKVWQIAEKELLPEEENEILEKWDPALENAVPEAQGSESVNKGSGQSNTLKT